MRPHSSLRTAVVGAAFAFLFVTGAAATPIDEKYAALGGAAGSLGMPASAEATAPDGVGKYRHYARGSVYWHPSTGAHEVIGRILQRWSELGWEKSYLGYPMSDELGTFDGGGRVSKFQGGELIWHAATGKVTEVRSSDLVVDVPFPPGQAWSIIQANAVTKTDSHSGPWAYCWDFMLAGKPQAQSNGALFVAAADGPILYTEQENRSVGLSGETNVVIQRWGAGRYASYLHIRTGSYTRRFGASAGQLLPQAMPSSRWPIAKSGAVLAEVGDVGAPVGAFHLHFCVTTKPDRSQFAPFESVPVAFRNYSSSSNEGRSWTFVATGVPRQGQWVRREPRHEQSAPQVNEAASVLSFGKVKGEISAPFAIPGAEGGKLIVGVNSAWGEPLAGTTVPIPAGNSAGPWSYEVADVPAFNKLKVSVAFEGSKGAAANRASGESAPFELKPSGSATVNVQVKN
jgi:LGFP repeat